ncbi:MAG TPA: pyridoxal phosphate-dependent aminotransferase [Candidatus Acidoferrales bacterium]|nr:pyridoxal phosphate-dependent aminotransferase [Candidatus Acidoferrales bacterium]
MAVAPKLVMQLADRAGRVSLSPTSAIVTEADRLRASGVDVINFGVGEPDFPTPDNIKQAAMRAIENNFTKYTPTPGIQPLREAVCAWHRREFGSSYQPEESVITVGGKQALFNALGSLVNDGDEVVIAAPYWVSYPDMIRFCGGEPKVVHPDPAAGFHLRAADVEVALGPRTRAVIVNSPNNPSGAVVAESEFARILELCASRNLWLITDECYSHFVYDGRRPYSVASLPEGKPHLIVAGSCSKTFSMTGWRIGYALAPKPLIDAMIRLQSQSTSNPNSIAQYAALEALTGPMDSVRTMLAEYARRRDLVSEALARIPGVVCAAPEGTFYAFPSVTGTPRARALQQKQQAAETERLAVDLLTQAHVGVVAGEAFGAPGYVRISFALAQDRLKEGLERLGQFLSA